MASFAVDWVVSGVAKILIEEYAVLGDAARHVEWIEKELRSMMGLLEQIEQRGEGEQEQALREWAEKLKDVALDAKDVIDTFVIKSVKRRRWGVLHWYDKYKVGKELEKIRKRMRDISQKIMNLNLDVSISVETPVVGGETPTPSNSAIIVVAMEKLDHILRCQNLITSNKVIKMVEEVKDGLKDLQNIVSKLKSTNERETVWLEEVNEVCNYMAEVAGNFIARREKWFKMSSRRFGLMRKVLYHDTSSWEFKKQMKHVSIQIGDALGRSLTYEVVGVGDTNERTKRSTPVQDLSMEILIISELIPFSIAYTAELFLLSHISSKTVGLAGVILIVVISQAFGIVSIRGPVRARKLNQKRGAILRLLTSSFFIYTLILLVIFILLFFIPYQIALLFQLSSPLYQVIVWIVKLCRSMDNNLKCVQRDLDLMHVFLRDTAESAESMNDRQRVWVDQLRVVAQNGRSLVDAAGNGGCWSRKTKFAKDINCLLEEILNISHRKTTYSIANIIQGATQQELVRSEEHPEPAASSSSYRPVTGLKQEVQSIRREMELMDALHQDTRDMSEIDRRSRIWVDQMQGIADEIASVIRDYDTKL